MDNKRPRVDASSSSEDEDDTDEKFMIVGTPSLEVMRDIVECPICMEVAKPPIFSCAKGHAVCGSCNQHVTKCGFCQDVHKYRCPALEELHESVSLTCMFRSSGCPQIGKTDYIEDHVKECEFRRIHCTDTRQKVCVNNAVEFKDYIAHQRDSHGMKIIELDEDDDEDAEEERKGTFTIDELDFLKKTDLTRKCKSFAMEFDSKWFVIQSYGIKKNFHIFVAILGSKDDASNYEYNFRFHSPSTVKSDAVYDNLEVVSIRDTFADLNNSQKATLSYERMKNLIHTNKKKNATKRVRVDVKIVKIQED